LFRWFFRILLALAILAALVAAAGLLLIDTITREALIKHLRARTGMEAEIGAVHVGLLSPTLSIQGLKLYNAADFGGTVCLNMPELHVEYDAAAFRARQLHLTLLRVDLEELSVLSDQRGRMNFDVLKQSSKRLAARDHAASRLRFTGIDALNVTLGKCFISNLASGRKEEIDFGITNQILRNVKTDDDLAPLGLAAVRHGQGDASVDLEALLKDLMTP
jgi:hypothetical protein